MYIKICLVFYVLSLIGVSGQDFDVLILGGGMAGATAARTLTELGIDNFVILEATERVGGRMKATTIGNMTVELGAGWVTGGEGNPIYDMVQERNMTTIENDYDDWQVIDSNGNDVTLQADLSYARMIRGFNFALDYRKQMLNSSRGYDFTMHNMMRYGGWISNNAIDEAVEYMEIDFETSYPGDMSSARYFYGENAEFPYGDEELFVMHQDGGYSTIVRGILDDSVPDWQNKTLFSTVVQEIDYSDGNVVVTTNNGIYTSRFAVVTFSLGVLQHEAVTFQPPLPEWKQEAIYGFNMGYYYHLYLRFPYDGEWFVPGNTEWTVFAAGQRGYFAVWQNIEKHSPGSRIMHGTITYNEAKRLDALSDTEIQAESMAVLRILFGNDIPEPEEMVMSRWISDPYTYGCFPDWTAGYSPETFRALQASIGPLYFAGDAYHNDFGYVNGAYGASIRETTKLVECLIDENDCIEYIPPDIL